jgi:hypothetical protein
VPTSSPCPIPDPTPSPDPAACPAGPARRTCYLAALLDHREALLRDLALAQRLCGGSP